MKCWICGAELHCEPGPVGPWAGRPMLAPARFVCDPCVERLHVPVHREPDWSWMFVNGVEFVRVLGVWAHSDNPAVAHIFREGPGADDDVTAPSRAAG